MLHVFFLFNEHLEHQIVFLAFKVKL